MGREWTDLSELDESRPVDLYVPSKPGCIDFDFVVEQCGQGCARGCRRRGGVGGGGSSPPTTTAQADFGDGGGSGDQRAVRALHASITIHCMPTMQIVGRTVHRIRGRIVRVRRKAGRRVAVVMWDPIRHPHTGRLEQPRGDPDVRALFFRQGYFVLKRKRAPTTTSASSTPSTASRGHGVTSGYDAFADGNEWEDVDAHTVTPDDLVVGAVVSKDWCSSDFHAPALFPSMCPSGFHIRAEQRTRHCVVRVALPAPPPAMFASAPGRTVDALRNMPLLTMGAQKKRGDGSSDERKVFNVVRDVLMVEHALDYFRGGPAEQPFPEQVSVETESVDDDVGTASAVPAGGPNATASAAGIDANARVDSFSDIESVVSPAPPILSASAVMSTQEHLFWSVVASALADSFRVDDVILGWQIVPATATKAAAAVAAAAAAASAAAPTMQLPANSLTTPSALSQVLRHHFWDSGGADSHLVFTVQRTTLDSAVRACVRACMHACIILFTGIYLCKQAMCRRCTGI